MIGPIPDSNSFDFWSELISINGDWLSRTLGWLLKGPYKGKVGTADFSVSLFTREGKSKRLPSSNRAAIFNKDLTAK
jgi:hypothetical protein